MATRDGSKLFYRQLAERSLARGRRRFRFGEDDRTLALGFLSILIGCIALGEYCYGLLGWKPGMREAIGSWGGVLVSSIAIVGLLMGGWGVRLGWKSTRRVSLCSALGTMLCYLPMAVVMILTFYTVAHAYYTMPRDEWNRVTKQWWGGSDSADAPRSEHGSGDGR